MSELHDELADLSPEQRELLSVLLREQGLDEGALLVPVARRPEGLPLSSAQQRMWFLQQLRPGSPFYNVYAALRLTGTLDEACLVRALDAFVQRHEPLRTVFPSHEGQALQRILAPAPAVLERLDLSALPSEERDARVHDAVERASLAGFELEHEPPCRFQLVRLGPEEHVLTFVTHHIVADGWSLGIFVQELTALYAAFLRAEPPALPELRVQYADFAQWERGRLEGGRERELLEYWRHRLEGLPETSTLPPDRPRPPLSRLEGALLEFALPPRLQGAVRALAQKHQVSVFTVFLGAFSWLLARRAGQSQVALGMPIANRSHAELEGLIGCFANTLVVRAGVSGAVPFGTWLSQVAEELHGAFEHQEVPFERLVDVLQPERRMDRHPLFQVFFAMQQHPLRRAPSQGLKVSEFPFNSPVARFDLEVHVWESAQGLEGTLIYDVGLYEEATVARLLRDYEQLLERVTENPQLTWDALAEGPAAPPALVEPPALVRAPDAPRTLAEALLQTARRFPDAGVCFLDARGERTVWSLASLVERARRLGAGLRSWGLVPGDKLVLVLGEDADTVEAFWACQLAGLVPIILPPPPPGREQAAARSRLMRARELLGGPRLLTRQALVAELGEQLGTTCALGDIGAIEFLRASEGTLPDSPARPEDLALLCLTSGTTGLPKCAMLTHHNLLVRAEAANAALECRPGERSLAWLPMHHIGALADWHLRPLLAGAVVFHAPSVEILAEPLRWLDWCEQHGITQTWAPSFAYGQVVERLRQEESRRWNLSGMRVLLSAGEQIPAPMVEELSRRLAPSGLRADAFVGAWGMTETSCGVTYTWRSGRPVPVHSLDKPGGGAMRLVDVGAPIAGVSLRIVDERGAVLPETRVGRVQVRGAACIPGYYADPEASAALLTPDGWVETGDLGFLSQGALTVSGRVKDLVIIHGANFSCLELEAAVEQVEGVEPATAAAVAVRPAEGQRDELAVFFVPSARMGPLAAALSRIRQYVLERVGVRIHHLVPLEAQALPRTEGGKLQRAELRRRFESGALSAPRLEEGPAILRPLEQRIAAVWSEVLGIGTVAPGTSFFDLGGNSILLVRVERALRQRLGVEVALMDLFMHPTVRSLAEHLERRDTVAPEAPAPEASAERQRELRGAALERGRARRRAQQD
ncbi:condensation domain-containing protein [Archangium violaceum]|uniref:condensation domain-containing protein n=1 Tax=Archangium violaceum TaxID=83451 RepID=UPI002B2E6157|nr:non-ribosomal peptide synthetase [Archangium gephyra]WPB75853.1 condensation domain-containing protein [Archangium gephyra]